MAFFSVTLISRSSLVCFPHWQSFLFLHAAGSVLRLRQSHKGPSSVMLQSLHPAGSSHWLLFSLFFNKTFMPLFFPASDYFILFLLTSFPNLFVNLTLNLLTLSTLNSPSHLHFLSTPTDTDMLKIMPFFLFIFFQALTNSKNTKPKHFIKNYKTIRK